MTAVVRKAKDLAPSGSRDVVRTAVRGFGQATSRWRPGPDFLIIGTKRGGTTTLFRALQDHPQVLPMFPSTQDLKSSHYYDLELERSHEWFLSHFPTERARRSNPAQPAISGEASPYYLFHPAAPARIRRDLPDIKLIVALRDPVSRAFSHHWDRVKNGVEELSFREAVDAEPERLAGERERLLADPTYVSHAYEHFSYVSRGYYAEQLETWFDLSPREQVLVLRSEDLYREPQATYDRVLDFLDLGPHQRRGEFGKHHGHADRPTIDPADAEHLRDHFAPHNQRLAQLLGTAEPWW